MSHVLVLCTAGTNCDEETAFAFARCGADVERLLLADLLSRERRLDEFDVLALPGGFSFGDDLGAGTVFAARLRSRLADDLKAFAASGRLVIGICNGFQVLVRLGLLPGWEGEKAASLIGNVSGKFEDRWIRLRVESERSPFLAARPPAAAPPARVLRLPVAHGEGRFVLRGAEALERLKAGSQVALRYALDALEALEDSARPAAGAYPENPNGSTFDIAGITNPAGNVLGLMPHPERFFHAFQDPLWTRRSRDRAPVDEDAIPRGDGWGFFENAVKFVDDRRAAFR
jgi:phosphoribosylformylglycinamidine synthase